MFYKHIKISNVDQMNVSFIVYSIDTNKYHDFIDVFLAF